MFSREIQNKIAPYEAMLRAIAVCIAAIAVVVLWISTMLKGRGDFLLHYEFGRRLIAGEFLYTNGMHLPYPPSWAMLFAPFSLLPDRVAKPVVFLIGLGALVALLAMMRDYTRKYFPEKSRHFFWLAAVVLLILSRFVLRDFADGGENLLIVALSWGGIYFFARRKLLPGGVLLGLAIALKCTPLIFAGYLVLKRQWLAACSALLFAALFFVSPVLIQGRNAYVMHIKVWKTNVLAGVSQKDPSMGVLGPDELANKSLRPMLARYLMQLPEDHPGRVKTGGYVDVLRLQPGTANIIIKAVTYGSFLLVMALFTFGGARLDSQAFYWECAVISPLMLLYSPITWGQHCVALIPALYLICLRFDSGKPVARWITAAMAAVAALFILVNRSILVALFATLNHSQLGFDLSELAESYHFITLCMIVLVIVSLALWSEAKKSPAPAAESSVS